MQLHTFSRLKRKIFWGYLPLAFCGCTSYPFDSSSTNSGKETSSPNSSLSRRYNSDEIQKNKNFEGNFNNDARAYFGIRAADCVNTNGSKGVYIINLNPNSVLLSYGVKAGDRILQLGAHYPSSSAELTYIIKRITPGTALQFHYEREGKADVIIVSPPSWKPTIDQQKRIDAPYDTNVCLNIGMRQFL